MTHAYHQKKTKQPHGNAKWTRAAFEPIMADIRNRMPRKEVCLKHNIKKNVLEQKIQQYHAGELR